MIGSTDAHTGLASTRDENFWGKMPSSEPAADRYEHYVVRASGNDSLSTFAWEEVSSGLAGVWARENTREALFDAMLKKEVYATTGTRITVRFFGGWDYESDAVFQPDAVSIGYPEACRWVEIYLDALRQRQPPSSWSVRSRMLRARISTESRSSRAG